MENKIYGIIYKITNLINKKVYIGKTKQKLNARWSGHKYCAKNNISNMNISNAIKKYGVENFKVEQIDFANNCEKLSNLEEYYIKFYKSYDNNFGYNINTIENGRVYRNGKSKDYIIKQNKSQKRRLISKNNGLKSRGKKIKGNFVGVHKTKNNNYEAVIGFNNKNIYLGSFKDESDAAKAYDIKAIELYGNNCVLNFPSLIKFYIKNEIKVQKIKKCKSEIKYLTYLKNKDYWSVTLRVNGIKICMKYFKNKNDAIEQLLKWYPNHEYFKTIN